MIKERISLIFLDTRLINFGSNHKAPSMIFFFRGWERDNLWAVICSFSLGGCGPRLHIQPMDWVVQVVQIKHAESNSKRTMNLGATCQEQGRNQNAQMAKITKERSHLKGKNKGRSDSSPFPTHIRNAFNLNVVLERTEKHFTSSNISCQRNYWEMLSKT